MTEAGERRATALLDRHKELGAKLTEFGGWDMPLQYEGIIAEHNAVRERAGLFDVSHLGKLGVSGRDQGEALQQAVTADVVGLEPGKATYALALTDDAGCIDDVFVYRLSPDKWLVVPNAANVFAVAESIRECGGEPVDKWDRWSILALQGPESFAIFESVFAGHAALKLGLHEWCESDFPGDLGLIARTGYTGERGFELYVPADDAPRVFDALLEAGAAPVGLGARDTLRLEMGYALYGHELTLDINPLEANLGWAVAWDSPFRGREALLKIKEAGAARKLFGIQCTDRGVPRQGNEVFVDGKSVGALTSGNYSPTLATGIGLALGPTETRPDPGSRAEIETRGRRIGGDIVKPPFIKKR
ncbi:MAG: glycine cleavage system aminomethyltransferase GcvT [Actinomycetota bacterium]|nr:glycine cleavage system aminomethyltransferase GcvT [Actinomycetota bacterium]